MAEPNPIQESGRPRRLTLALLLKWPYGRVGSAIILIIILAGVFGPFVAPYDPYKPDVTAILKAPDATHWFGTDDLGRDILSRMLWATRTFLYIGLVGVGAGAAAGALGGLAFGRGVGKLANFIRGLMKLAASIPIVIFPLWAIPVMLSVMAFLGTGFWMVILGIATIISLRLMPSFYAAWITSARAMDQRAYDSSSVPSDTMVAKKPLFLLTLTGLGLSVGMAILLESWVSFVGLGIPPTHASLGGMLGDGVRHGGVAASGTIFPGIAILVGTLGFALLAHSVREFYDTAVQLERPWFYRTWFLIVAFFLWPIWTVLIVRSPWHKSMWWKALAWSFGIFGGYVILGDLSQEPLAAWFPFVLIVILLVVILSQWDRVRAATSGTSTPSCDVTPPN